MLDQLRGHRLAGTFVALQSLFRFAKRHRMIFADPTRRLHIGHAAPTRALLPMTDTQIAAVAHIAVTPAQRLVVALVAVHAARAAAVRELTLDDVDLAGRRITLAGHPQRLGEFVHGALLDWLQERQRIWPRTPNRHVLVSAVTATGTAPISDYYLSWHLLLRGVQLEQIRGDRVLHEALAVRADPLHLAAVFHLSTADRDRLRRHRPQPARTTGRGIRAVPARPVRPARAARPGRVHDVPRPGSLIEPDAITIVSAEMRWVRSDDSSFTLNTPANDGARYAGSDASGGVVVCVLGTGAFRARSRGA